MNSRLFLVLCALFAVIAYKFNQELTRQSKIIGSLQSELFLRDCMAGVRTAKFKVPPTESVSIDLFFELNGQKGKIELLHENGQPRPATTYKMVSYYDKVEKSWMLGVMTLTENGSGSTFPFQPLQHPLLTANEIGAIWNSSDGNGFGTAGYGATTQTDGREISYYYQVTHGDTPRIK